LGDHALWFGELALIILGPVIAAQVLRAIIATTATPQEPFFRWPAATAETIVARVMLTFVALGLLGMVIFIFIA
jgi:hypothetical protein